MGFSLKKLLNPVTVLTGGANLVNEKIADAVGVEDPVAEHITSKAAKLPDKVVSRAKEFNWNPTNFQDVKSNLKLTNPEAAFGLDLAHRTSTNVVGGNLEFIEKTTRAVPFISKSAKHWDQMSQKDHDDQERWAKNTASVASMFVGGGVAKGAGLVKTGAGFVAKQHAAEDAAERLAAYNQAKADAAAKAAAQPKAPSFADYLAQLAAQFKASNPAQGGAGALTAGGATAQGTDYSSAADGNRVLLIGGAVVIFAALLLKS
jgi:hypothetical protein